VTCAGVERKGDQAEAKIEFDQPGSWEMRKLLGVTFSVAGGAIVMSMIVLWVVDELFGEKSCFAIRNWSEMHLNSVGYSNCIFGYSLQIFLLLCIPGVIGGVIGRIGLSLLRSPHPDKKFSTNQ